MSDNRHNMKNRLLRGLICIALSVVLALPAGLPYAAYGAGEEGAVTVEGQESAGGSGAGQTDVNGGGENGGSGQSDQSGQSGEAGQSGQSDQSGQSGGTGQGGSDGSQTQGGTENGGSGQNDQSGQQAAGTDAEQNGGTGAGSGETPGQKDETAAGEQGETPEEEEPPAPVVAKRLTVSGIDMTFKNNVVVGEFLGSDMYTNTLKTTGNKKSIKLTWSSVKNKSGITGYYIIKKDKNGSRWRHIATVGRNATSYTDKTAKVKNRGYYYTIVAFQKKDGYVRISKASSWAASVTSKSKKKKNVYSVSLSRPAACSVMPVGGKATVSLSFPKKAFSKSVRWSTSNANIATVSNGTLTGTGAGTVTVYARLHTGRIFSTKVKVIEPGSAEGMLTVMRSWLGYSRRNGKHKGIVDIYNSVLPRPAGYKMKYTDAWCDATITAAAIRSGNVDVVGRECSVDRHIKIFKEMGIWEEDGTIVPTKGDIIVYNWRKSTQPNDTNASHIGIVEKVSGDEITVIEGNRGLGVVARRIIPVGWGYIRGYGRPYYSDVRPAREPDPEPEEETTQESEETE